MAKLMCAQCGGKVKMANGGTSPNSVLTKAKAQMYGIPQTGTTNYSAPTMKKGGTHKMPNGKVMLNSKMQNGGYVVKPKPIPINTGTSTKPILKPNYVGKPTKLNAKPKKITTKDIYKGKNGAKLMKMGGTTKETKFAALAPPYNKATFADRIAGAKKKK